MFTSIKHYQQQLLSGQTTCEATVNYYLQQIENNQHLNAFVEVFAAEALNKAIQLDNQRKTSNQIGALHGVVVAIKDVISYKDHKVTAASKILEGFIAIYTASALEKLLAAGAIIIGNCNCDEFAMGSSNENSTYGNVLNAADISKVPGGSSGGSAVAVQAGMCMVSLGSDTGGSVRQPADFCGIVGLKPTYGRISRYGLIAYASSFDQIGIFANSVADITATLLTLAGPDEFDSTAIDQEFIFPVEEDIQNNTLLKQIKADKKYRIAYFKEALQHPSLDKEINSAILSTINKLKESGHSVEAVDFNLLDYVVPAYYVLTTAEASSNLNRYDGVRFGHRTAVEVADLTSFYKLSRSEGFGKEVQRRILLGTFVLSTGYYDAYFTKAQQVRRLLVNKITEIFAQYDAIILPTSPTTAFSIGKKNEDPIAIYLADIYTVFANLTGVPAISLPLYKHTNGLPFGLQVMTNKMEEVTLLELSTLLMEQFKQYSPL